MTNKLNILVLEDELVRREWFNKIFFTDNIDFCFTAEKAIKLLQNNQYDLVFLDRDLGDTSDTNNNGEKVALEIMKQKLNLNATIVIHTMNDYGQKTMRSYLEKTHNVENIPYTLLLKLKREDFN